MSLVRVHKSYFQELVLEKSYYVLSNHEQTRSNQFSHDQAKEQFIKSRAFLRQTLSDYVGEPAETLKIANNAYGKPYLEDFDHLHFNVSHSGDVILIAVGHMQVGIDIEYIDQEFAHDTISDLVFNISEQQIVKHQKHDLKAKQFYSIWTKKEAYLKAKGHGFSCDPQKISTSCQSGVVVDLENCNASKSWYVKDLPISESYIASLATPQKNVNIEVVKLHKSRPDQL
ncbi:MAG: 4'-phosphopantetheinyl transferase superfamily protein [Pseudomonadota bacterium]